MPYSELGYSAHTRVTQGLHTHCPELTLIAPSPPIDFAALTQRLLPSYSEFAPKLLRALPHITWGNSELCLWATKPFQAPQVAPRLALTYSQLTHMLLVTYTWFFGGSLSSSSFTHCNYSFLIGYPDMAHLAAHSWGYSDFNCPFTHRLLTPPMFGSPIIHSMLTPCSAVPQSTTQTSHLTLLTPCSLTALS